MKPSGSPDNADSDSDSEMASVSQRTGIHALSTLGKTVSPPPIKRKTKTGIVDHSKQSLAAIEAGQVELEDHLETISANLKQYVRPTSESIPRLDMSDFTNLYHRNEHDEGCHFVIHQHDHPLAGPHYDLRLQFSKTSSVSWSVMYGLPGDPNSQKLNRNATETRVHCLWNHLIEAASMKTGSLIIWDTGEYEVLPYEETQPETDDSRSECSDHSSAKRNPVSNSAKLQQAFQNRKIRLRLHGTRLPKGYTVFLRMDKSTDYARPIRKGPKRRRKGVAPSSKARAPSTSDSEPPETESPPRKPPAGATADEGAENDHEMATHSDDGTDLKIQINNAYPGSSNTIGSIHQRRWWLSMDRESSGFKRRTTHSQDLLGSSSRKRTWVRSLDRNNILQGFEPFYVRGPDAERSVVTGRLGKDVLDDEKVDGFVPRKGWRGVLK